MRVKRSGPPSFAPTQRDEVLRLLREAGSRGVYRERFLIPTEYGGFGISQVGARLDELEKMGYSFESFYANESDRFLTYRLLSEPASPKPLPAFQRKPSEHAERTRRLEAEAMPLFAGVH